MVDESAAPEGGQAANPGEGANASWIDGLGDDAKGYIDNKGWKEPGDLLTSYQNLEKLRGVPEEQLLKLPDDPSKDGAMDGVWSKLGRPESSDKYTKAVPDEFSGDVYKKIAETAFQHGVSDKAFEAMQKDMTDLAAATLTQKDEEAAAQFDDWKGKNEAGFQQAAKVMATVGVNEEQLAGILDGDKAALYDFLAKVGGRTAEAPVINGDQGGGDFGTSPGAAKVKIAELMGDKEFMAQYTSSNQKVRQPAIDRLSRLHEAAAKVAGA